MGMSEVGPQRASPASVSRIEAQTKQVKSQLEASSQMSNPTEAEVRTAEGDELNRMVELVVYKDDLSCFEPDGMEREDRLKDAIHEWYWRAVEYGSSRWKLRNKFHHGLLEQKPRGRGDKHGMYKEWKCRHSKPYQSDLETHVNNYRADARDFEGDMNLAMLYLWHYRFELSSYSEDKLCVAFWGEPGEMFDVNGDKDKPAQAICRAAVILELREETA